MVPIVVGYYYYGFPLSIQFFSYISETRSDRKKNGFQIQILRQIILKVLEKHSFLYAIKP